MALRQITDDCDFSQIYIPRFPIVLYFETRWCPPCIPTKKMIENYLNEFSEQKQQFFQIDGDKCHKLVEKYNVFALPTILMINSEFQVIQSLIGHHPQKIKQFLRIFSQKVEES